jgi:endonuclease G, mitochondrial
MPSKKFSNDTAVDFAAGGSLRIAHMLRSSSMREELSERITAHKLSPNRAASANALSIIGDLARPITQRAAHETFDTRRSTEAIVLLAGRPVLLVKGGEFERCNLKSLEKQLAPHRKALIKPISAVGRIELSDHETFEWCGTGWRVDEDLIVTNRHVANSFAERQGNTFRFQLGRARKTIRARVDFSEEYHQPDSNEHAIAKILWVAPNTSEAPDMAVLQVSRSANLPKPLTLAKKDPKPEDLIAVVGYPARDSRNDADAQHDIFGDIFDVKRFAPGEVMEVPSGHWAFHHDCTTLGGNSGSAVFSVATGEVVGLHYGGGFRESNVAVKASVIKSLLRRRSWVPVSRTELKISEEGFSEKKRKQEDLADRKGFDEKFLGVMAKMPVPGASHQVQKVGAKTRLDYTHFSVVMSKTRRLAIATAVNIDGEQKRKLKRKDSWGFDPRLPVAAQVGHKEFYGPMDFDKGHMVRREDPGWGTPSAAQQGEDDSFVYPNAVPQVPQLNQRSWLSLEDYVLDSAKTEGFKVSVFTGPVLRDDDPTYQDLKVPLDFWKVVAMIDADTHELVVSAYMLSQEGLMPQEGFRFGPFKTYQVPLSKVEEAADIKFSDAMRKADVFGASGREEAFAAGRFVEIESASDIVLSRK